MSDSVSASGHLGVLRTAGV